MPATTTQQFGTLEPFDGADFTDYRERLMPTSSHITSVKLQQTPAKQLNERQTRKKSPLQSP